MYTGVGLDDIFGADERIGLGPLLGEYEGKLEGNDVGFKDGVDEGGCVNEDVLVGEYVGSPAVGV
jgi:hypothetical protein